MNLNITREIKTTSTWQLDFYNTIEFQLNNVHIFQWQWDYEDPSGKPLTKVYYSSVSGLSLKQFGSQYSFVAIIDRCIFQGSSIYMQCSDSKIMNSYLWALDKEYCVKVDYPYVSILNCDIVPSSIKGGIWITENGRWAQITGGNHFDGSYDFIPTGWGINCEGDSCTIQGNIFYSCLFGGVRLNSSINTIVGNTFHDSNRVNDPNNTSPTRPDGTAYSDILILKNQNIITSNTFENRINTTLNAYSIEDNADFNIINSNIHRGNYKDNGYKESGANTIWRDNL